MSIAKKDRFKERTVDSILTNDMVNNGTLEYNKMKLFCLGESNYNDLKLDKKSENEKQYIYTNNEGDLYEILLIFTKEKVTFHKIRTRQKP